jgi:hypothetical protein
MFAAPRSLGGVEREVGVADQPIAIPTEAPMVTLWPSIE